MGGEPSTGKSSSQPISQRTIMKVSHRCRDTEHQQSITPQVWDQDRIDNVVARIRPYTTIIDDLDLPIDLVDRLRNALHDFDQVKS